MRACVSVCVKITPLLFTKQMSDLELRNKDKQDIVHQLTADLAKQKSGKYLAQDILQVDDTET